MASPPTFCAKRYFSVFCEALRPLRELRGRPTLAARACASCCLLRHHRLPHSAARRPGELLGGLLRALADALHALAAPSPTWPTAWPAPWPTCSTAWPAPCPTWPTPWLGALADLADALAGALADVLHGALGALADVLDRVAGALERLPRAAADVLDRPPDALAGARGCGRAS